MKPLSPEKGNKLPPKRNKEVHGTKINQSISLHVLKIGGTKTFGKQLKHYALCGDTKNQMELNKVLKSHINNSEQ